MILAIRKEKSTHLWKFAWIAQYGEGFLIEIPAYRQLGA